MTKKKILACTVRQNDLTKLTTILRESITIEESYTSESSISQGNLAIYYEGALRAALSNAAGANSINILPDDVANVINARSFINDYDGVVEVKESGGGFLSILSSILCCVCIFGVSQNEMNPSMYGQRGFRGDGFNDDYGDPIA